MTNPIRDFLLGAIAPKRPGIAEAFVPQRTFKDVILPPATRRALDHALIQIQKHDLIFNQWGLGERHATGRGLAFNFAGPPGTGKTICAEAIAHALRKRLMVVRYSEVESLWAGETGKNVSALFRSANEENAVLFFDEADAIASRRFSSITQGFQREANSVVNVLLKELEEFDGVVIFATNLASNFDPAFERRIRTHILFTLPGAAERAQIWKVQLHAHKTPLAADVDFDELAQKYEVAGGEIKNAVLKAAQMATAEPGPDSQKKIHQRHFIAAMKEVLSAKEVMGQTLFEAGDGSHISSSLDSSAEWKQLMQLQQSFQSEQSTLRKRIRKNEQRMESFPAIIERFDDATRAVQEAMRAELSRSLEQLRSQNEEHEQVLGELRAAIEEFNQNSEALRETMSREIETLKQESDRRFAETSSAHSAFLAAWKTRWIILISLGASALFFAIFSVVAHFFL